MSDASAAPAAVDTSSTPMPDLSNDSGDVNTSRDEIQAAIDAVSGDTDGHENTGSNEPSNSGTPRNEPKLQEEDNSKREPSQPKSSAWASLHKKQVEFQQARAEFNKEKAEVERVKGLIENAKTDRLSALEALGYTDVKSFIEGLVEDGGRMTPERKKVLELEKKIADRERREEEQSRALQEQHRTQAQRAQLDALHNQVVNTIKEHHADSLAAIDGSSQAIMQEMDRLAGEHGVMPDIAEAIRNVSANYEKNFRQILENPRARSIAQELLASNKSAPAPRSKASINTIDSSVSASTMPARKDGPYDPNDELEQMVKWMKTQK